MLNHHNVNYEKKKFILLLIFIHDTTKVSFVVIKILFYIVVHTEDYLEILCQKI